MLLKFLPLAGFVCVSAENLRTHDRYLDNGRSLQASASCMAFGTPFADCCPCAKPDDGVCTLLWCFDLNELVIQDECKCGQLADACDKLGLLLGAAEGLTEMCAKAKECCGDTEASNGDFDACIADVAVPDLARLIPGGIPDVSSMGSPVCADSGGDEATETAATQGTIVTLPTVPSEGTIVTLPTEPSKKTEVTTLPTEPSDGVIVTLPAKLSEETEVTNLPTEPSKETEVTLPTEPSDGVIVTLPTEAADDTVPVTKAPKNTTEMPEVDDTTPDDSPDDGLNGANKYTVGTLMTLVGSTLSILFV